MNLQKNYVELDQQHKLLQFLMGLNESYAPVRSHTLMMTQLPSVSTAFAIISPEESHRSMAPILSHHSDSPASAVYLVGNQLWMMNCVLWNLITLGLLLIYHRARSLLATSGSIKSSIMLMVPWIDLSKTRGQGLHATFWH